MFPDKKKKKRLIYCAHSVCCVPKGADKKQKIIHRYRWIYSNVMLYIMRKIFLSLQERKLKERDENIMYPAKQK